MADLVTITEYKAYAGITATDTTRDASITALLPIVSESIRRYCGRDLTAGFEDATWTETYDGNDSDQLQLREWPVASITSIALISDSGTSTTWTSTTYRLTPRSGLVSCLGSVSGRFAGRPSSAYTFSGCWSSADSAVDSWGTQPCWPAGNQNLTVVYVTTAGVPSGVKFAAYRMLDYAMSDRQQGGIKSESLGGYSVTYGGLLEKDQELKGLLAPYRTGGL